MTIKYLSLKTISYIVFSLVLTASAAAQQPAPQKAAAPCCAKPQPKPKPKKWVVQYNHQPFPGGAGNWETLVKPPHRAGELPAEGVYTSRNEAYRQIKLRAKKVGALESSYRVVPEGTKGGPELDRGYYRLQFWDSKREVWYTSAAPAPLRTADEARQALRANTTGLTCRVKWFPNAA